MTCAEFEVTFCDYLDGLLRDPEKSALEEHLRACTACAELAADIRASVEFMERVEPVTPPAELLTRILHDIPSAKQKPERRSWYRRLLGGPLETILQPRFAMGMAMTMLSFSMLVKFTGISPRQLTPADLNPVRIWAGLDDQAHRVWDRAMKYYDNMRLVIEVQSRLKEWSEQEQEQRLQQQRQQQKRENVSAPKEQKQ